VLSKLRLTCVKELLQKLLAVQARMPRGVCQPHPRLKKFKKCQFAIVPCYYPAWGSSMSWAGPGSVIPVVIMKVYVVWILQA